MKNSKDSINHLLLHLNMVMEEAEKKTRKYGTDIPIHHAEIHMVAKIAEQQGTHIGGLAEQLNITKASVSELVGKLVKKGLVKKEVSEHNLSRLSLRLTEKGELAHRNHINYHEEFSKTLYKLTENATEHEIGFLESFLRSIIEMAVGFNEKKD